MLEAKAKGRVSTKQASSLRKDQMNRNDRSLIKRRSVDNSVYDGRNAIMTSSVTSLYKKAYNQNE